MSAGPKGQPGTSPADDRLDSWKEIAAYLGREVRTVQGWEKTEGLPVHRHLHSRQGSVYAFRSELDAWREARRGIPEVSPNSDESPAESTAVVKAGGRKRLPILVGALAALLAAVSGSWWWVSRMTPASGEMPNSVVVLPFLDLSPQKDQEYFSDGLTEELIDALTRVPNLRVVARTSAFAFKGKGADIREIGKQLNVAAILEGSVRKDGDRLRITAQLARASDGYHLWSNEYDRRLSDVFAVQREISQSIADLLRAGPIPKRDHPTDMEAYRLYQEGRYLFNKFEAPESNYKAIERYRQAIQRDPKMAIAYAGLSDAYSYLSENFVAAPKEVIPKAREAAEKAVELDPSLADGHTALGIVKLDYDRDREGGQREFLRAMQLSPGSGWARHWYAHSLEAQDRLPEAMKEMRAALDLDPLSIPINWDVAGELLTSGQIDNALKHLKKAEDLFPNVPVFDFLELKAYAGKGDRTSARRIIDRVKTLHTDWQKDPMFVAMVGTEAAMEDRRAEARELMARLETLRQTQYVDAFMGLPLASALGDRDQLQLWTKRAAEEHSSMFVYLRMMKALYGLDSEMLAAAEN